MILYFFGIFIFNAIVALTFDPLCAYTAGIAFGVMIYLIGERYSEC